MSIFSHSSIYVLHLKIIKKHLTLLNSWLKNIYKNLCVGGACFSQEIHEMMQNYFYSSMRNKKCKDEAFLCVLYVEKATVKFKERTKRGFHTKYSATNGATLIKQKIIFGELKKKKELPSQQGNNKLRATCSRYKQKNNFFNSKRTHINKTDRN